MIKPADVVCLVIWEVPPDTYDTQVLAPLSKHASDVRPRVLVCDPKRPAAPARERFGVQVSAIPAVPSRAGWHWKDLLLFKRWLRSHYSPSEPFVVHAKGSRPTLLALEMRRWFSHVRVIFDCRSAEPAEYREWLESKGALSEIDGRRLRQVELVERRAATVADHIFCASHALAGYLSQRYPDQLPGITVVPACVDAGEFAAAARDRDTVRRELGVAGKLVVAYKGSLHPHQYPDGSLRIFKAIKALRPDAHFLGLTPGTDRLRHMCRQAGIEGENCTVLPIETATMARCLAASDIGLLPRRQTLVNRMVSPVKFAEYLASGTPVIVSDQLGDYTELVTHERVGVVLSPTRSGGDLDLAPLSQFLSGYSSNLSEWRHRCRHIARHHFDWSVHLPRISAAYHDAPRGSYLSA
jgi:glycosyltransferase involved in cell wall biosynthesis